MNRNKIKYLKMVLSIMIIFAFGGNSKLSAQDTSPKIGGLLQVWSKNGINQDYSTFMLKRMEIAVSGSFSNNKVSYAAMIDPVSKTKKVDESGNNEHILSVAQDLFINYRFSNRLIITAGQFLVPITREGLTPSGDLLFPERSLVGRVVGDKRDIGIKLSGKYSLFSYTAALLNGNGQDNIDNDSKKNIAARIVAEPAIGFEVGASLYQGKGKVNKLNVDKNRYGFDLCYSTNNWGIIGEYAVLEDGDLKDSGYYGTVYYNFNEKIYTAARYEGWIVDDNSLEKDMNVLSIGLGYNMKKHNLKLQCDYTGTFMDNEDTVGELTIGIQLSY